MNRGIGLGRGLDLQDAGQKSRRAPDKRDNQDRVKDAMPAGGARNDLSIENSPRSRTVSKNQRSPRL